MNPEMKPVVEELTAQLERIRAESQQLVGQVRADHPHAQYLTSAITTMTEAIDSLKQIGFGLMTDFSYDD